jgi:caffeoyl-CoA O-methyltransferase
MQFIDARIEAYAHDRTRAEPEPVAAVARATATLPGAGMCCGRLEGRLLKLLAGLARARRVLEIGTFTGYSALSLAEALPDDGRLITCELDPTHADIARRNFATSPHGAKIELRQGAALDTLKTLSAPFELVFIDADKANYPSYWRAAAELVPVNGLIAVDNALWSGRVLAPADAESRAIDETNRLIAADGRFDNVLLPIRDGVHLARRLR